MLRRTGLSDREVIAAYMYGSRVYGNHGEDSDWDFIVVSDCKRDQFSDNLINVNFYSMEAHMTRLKSHEPSAMECMFLPAKFRLKEAKPLSVPIRPEVLRSAFSAKASNSWVKAKKKLTVEMDYDRVGKKSLWHSIRIVDFGTQIATHGSIVDYASCNGMYGEVMGCNDWQEMFDKYKGVYNAACTAFRAAAPKTSGKK